MPGRLGSTGPRASDPRRRTTTQDLFMPVSRGPLGPRSFTPMGMFPIGTPQFPLSTGGSSLGTSRYGGYGAPQAGPYPYQSVRSARQPAWQTSVLALPPDMSVSALDLAYLQTPGSAGVYYGTRLGMDGGLRYPIQGQAPEAPAKGGGGVGGGGYPSWFPPGIDPKWYAQFMKEHGGQTAEQFYSNVGRYGEGLAEALADRQWGDEFAREHGGRAPTQDEWTAHYYGSRPGAAWAAMSKLERKAERKASRKRWKKDWASEKGYSSWGEYESMLASGEVNPGESKAEAQARKQKELEESRGPLYVPPQFSWR